MQSSASSLPVASTYCPSCTVNAVARLVTAGRLPRISQPHSRCSQPPHALAVATNVRATQHSRGSRHSSSSLPDDLHVRARSTVDAVARIVAARRRHVRASSTVDAVAASSLPVASTYVPAAQSMQSAARTAVVSTYVPAAQSMQSAANALPVASTYVPAAQSMQSPTSSLPVASTYCPAAQSMHTFDREPPAVVE